LTGFPALVAALTAAGLRFVLIGVAGANHWARSGAAIFTTQDYDLFLPLDPEAELAAWRACQSASLELWSDGEPLGPPLDLWLAEAVVSRRALVRASDGRGLDVDLSLVMAGFDFETVWSERRMFLVDGVEIPVARLSHIVESKARAGREKDRLFLASHADALRDLMNGG
jgi:hypothetical protein